VLVVFEDHDQAQAVDERIALLRGELHKPATFEFHFTDNNDAIREAFLRAVAPFDFFYTGLVVNKARLYTPEFRFRAAFYKDVCGQVFDHAKPRLQNAIVKIDRSGGQGFRRELAAYLKRQVNDPNLPTKHIKKVDLPDSKSNNLLQLADMICGAVARHYREDKSEPGRFRKIIAHREFAVRLWPKETPSPIGNAERSQP
jgi:hypothetical protein